ncbi:glycoside hydrolase family 172 protein [Mangrovimonas sp. ST2L15]|uniref:glycoside hydrolase family 172 protein n=1 Tax=Mangrovimonas sp. ST2L15 TaxID=1645916 RepID=UPI0006B47D84|nr:glycoside hydrolase family 172 protein [Mangrovimonas sp. ST2L15]
MSLIHKLSLLVLLFIISGSPTLFSQELYQLPKNKHTKWVSFENISGDKGQGGIENEGAKGHAFDNIKGGASVNLVNLEGSGTIKRIWLTFSDRSPEMLRSLKIEMFWDGSDKPAVSAPIGDFFGVGLGQRVPFESALFSDPEGRSFNCIIPMPFKTEAKITVTNESQKDLEAIFFDVDVLMEEHKENVLYFHTYWSRDLHTKLAEDFKVLPKIKGSGRFLGTNIGVYTDPVYEDTWFGEGEVKIYLDGDKDYPSLVGSGTEDYIGTAYGQGPFSHQYQGSPIANAKKGEYAFYRYHIPDPVFFYENMEVTIQQIGGAPAEKVREMIKNGVPMKPISVSNKSFHKLLEMPQPVDLTHPDILNGWTNFYRSDDVSATAYFYLDSPVSNLPQLAPVDIRTSNLHEKP